ncbi:MAG: hypothetical protein CMI17_07530 [Opitutaceae bacterium]|nr:hypothetical protein [Opitutaceae bacterium]
MQVSHRNIRHRDQSIGIITLGFYFFSTAGCVYFLFSDSQHFPLFASSQVYCLLRFCTLVHQILANRTETVAKVPTLARSFVHDSGL